MTNNYFKVSRSLPTIDHRTIDIQFLFFDTADKDDSHRKYNEGLRCARKCNGRLSVWRGTWPNTLEISGAL
jgi:hypothetical protein